METVNATQEPTLTRADRCEAACPAAAMVRVTTENLGVWLFCGHHADLNIPVMPGVIHIHDERQPLAMPTKAVAE